LITKKKALEIMENYQSGLLKTMKDVDFAIYLAASTGCECISFFYPSKASLKLKNTLRKNKFYLETLTFRSNPTQEFITVVWDSKILESQERYLEVEYYLHHKIKNL
jgi:hypothetical protein